MLADLYRSHALFDIRHFLTPGEEVSADQFFVTSFTSKIAF